MKISPTQIDSYIKNIAQNREICGALVYGPESGLVSIRSAKICRAIVPDSNDPFLITNISEQQINQDISILDDEFFAIPMLPGRKLVVVQNAKNNLSEILKAIFSNKINPEKQNFIVLIAGELDKNSSLRKLAESSPFLAAIACYEDDKTTTIQIIRQKFQEYQLQCENGVMEMIAEKFGKNRLLILNEIDKLALFSGDDKYISYDIAHQVTGGLEQISIDEFVNNFALLDITNAYKILDKLFLEKINSVTLLRYLANYFNKLLVVKNNLQRGSNIEFEIKEQRLFFKQEAFFRKHLQLWNINRIQTLLFRLQKVEIACKTSGYNAELLFKAFIASNTTKLI